MPKRKNKDCDSDDYILRKIKKLEKKLKRRTRKRSSSVTSEDSNLALSLQEDTHHEESAECTVENEHIIDDGNNTTELSPTGIQDSTLQITQPDLLSTDPNLPTTSTASSEPAIVLDESILELLGETPSKNKTYGPAIQAELAVRWEHIATTGLSKDMKKDLLEKHHLPENCLKIGAPSLNPEVKAALSDNLVKKDKVIESKQNQQATAISCISQALTKIFASQTKDAEVIKLLIDGIRLLCDSQYVESMARRSFVTSTIKKDIKDHLYTTDVDSFLFGEKLSDTLRSAKAINKSGAEMKTSAPSQPRPANYTQNKPGQQRFLNSKPPLPFTRQAGVRRSTPATQQPRRYQAPHPTQAPPPSTASGHQRTPLAPPQRSRGQTQTRR
ncbi:uncharacterized protein LOC135074820 [Ostrinia nubilalis]|uniref:uncharacterized protein LOC135074820 n=1 Tax=Ostrinia nubilalis TaxID=29057 RepID=UPI00308261A8